MASSQSPYVPVFRALLLGIGWHGPDRTIVSAMPHDAVSPTIQHLKQTLEHLKIETFEARTRLDTLSSQDCPCLFVTDQGEVFGVLGREADRIHVQRPGAEAPQWEEAKPTFGKLIKLVLPKPELVTKDPVSFAQIWTQKTLVSGLIFASLLTNLFAFATPFFVMALYNRVMPVGSASLLLSILIGLGIILVTDLVIRLIRARTIAFLGAQVELSMGTQLFKKLMSLPLSLLQNSDINQQLTRFRQFEGLRDAFTGPVLSSFLDLPFTLIFLVVIYQISPAIGACVIVLAVVFAIAYVILVPVQKNLMRHSVAAKNDHQSLVMELARHQRSIRRLGAEELWRRRLYESSEISAHYGRKSRQLGLFTQTFGQTLMMLAGASTIVYGTQSAMAGDMTMGALIASMALVWRVLAPIHALFNAAPQISGYMQSIAQSNRVLQIDGELTRSSSNAYMKTFTGQLSARGLVFRYSAQSDLALSGVSFSFAAGERVALSGSNGSGKSTLLNMIDALYVPQSGSLAMDNVDFRQIPVEDLRASVSYAPQIAQFFHGTIKQNLLLANPIASEEEVWQAIVDSGLETDVRHLPDGIETRLSEEMRARMSPAVLRALMLARTFVKPASVYLIDEPFNGLDAQKEAAFFRILDRLRGKSTVVVVTRRPSHYALMDRVVYMHQARIMVDDKADIAAKKIRALENMKEA